MLAVIPLSVKWVAADQAPVFFVSRTAAGAGRDGKSDKKKKALPIGSPSLASFPSRPARQYGEASNNCCRVRGSNEPRENWEKIHLYSTNPLNMTRDNSRPRELPGKAFVARDGTDLV